MLSSREVTDIIRKDRGGDVLVYPFFLFALLLPVVTPVQTFDTHGTNNYWYGYFDSIYDINETSDPVHIHTGTCRAQKKNYGYILLLNTDSGG